MTLADLERLERKKLERRNQQRQRALGKKIKTGKIDPELPQVRSTGMIIGMTPEEQKAFFERVRKDSGV